MKKLSKYIKIFICSFFLIILTISFIRNSYWIIENKKITNLVKKVQKNTRINFISNDNVELINEKSQEKNESYVKIKKGFKLEIKVKENPYYKLKEKSLINVDINKLKNFNKDIIGWITIDDTDINYPIVNNNNDYYLNHSLDKKKNNIGWIYFKNNTICAFSNVTSDMDRSIKKMLYGGWRNNFNNYSINLSTEKENTMWQIFSIYFIKRTNCNNYKINRNSKKLLNKSSYELNTNITNKDKVITFITPFNDNESIVIHAKLIKKQIK